MGLYIYSNADNNLQKQNSPEEETELKKLKDIEKSVEQTVKKLEKVDGELTGLKNVSNQLWFLRCIIFLHWSDLFSHIYFEDIFV